MPVEVLRTAPALVARPALALVPPLQAGDGSGGEQDAAVPDPHEAPVAGSAWQRLRPVVVGRIGPVPAACETRTGPPVRSVFGPVAAGLVDRR